MTGARHKQLALHLKAAAAPDEAQLAKIRAFTLADIPAEELYVRTFVLAHNAIDRDKECFGEQLLGDFARTLPGKGLFIRHPMGWDGDTGPGEGRWFDAELVRMSHADARTLLRQPGLQFPPDHLEAVLLMASAYMVRGEDNRDLLRKVDAGIVSDVSISFTAKDMERLKDDAGRELAAWRYLGPGEALEGSLVWLGAQPGARAIKHANHNPTNQENAVDELKKQLEQAEQKAATATQRAEANQKAADSLTHLKTALGEAAALLDDPTALKAAIDAGAAYRKSLIEDVVAAERRLGLVGDTPEAKAAAEQLHAGEGIDRLKALAEHYGKASDKGGGLGGGDPNPARPAGQKAAGVLGNPLIAGAAGAAN